MFPQQGFRRVGVGGGGLTNLTIQNTLYVMKNGNDATGLPNRLDKPYLTIFEASQNASVGDTIYVFSGTYNEGVNDIFADNVNYVLQEGVTVECTTKVVSDFGVARNINIVGQGILKTTAGGEGVVYMTNSDSVLNLQCYQVLGEGIAIACTGNYNIKVNYVSSVTSRAIYFSDSLGVGGKTFGTAIIDKISVLSGFGAVNISGTNTDLVQRNIYFYCNELINQSSKAGGSSIDLLNNNSTRIYIQCKSVSQLALTRLFTALNSYFFINNTNFEGVEVGLYIEGSSVGLISNSNVLCLLNGISCINTANVQMNNCTIKNTGAYSSLELDNASELFAIDCVFVSGTGANSTASLLSTNKLRIKNCQFIASDPATISSIVSSSLATDIYVYGQCSANKPTQANLTNQVAGTNIVVDADIIQNTTNFF